jgi:glycosyltransferase involved in cell wall biosynthesis
MSTHPFVPNRKVRVAHVIQNLNYGGMERVLHSLARRLPSKGFQVHIVALEYLGHFSKGLGDAVTLHRVPPMSRLSILRAGNLITLLRGIAPDIVHSHTGVWLKASRAARAAGVPVVVHTEHGRPDPIPLADRLIDHQASRSTDRIIAVSEALAGVLRSQVVHDPERICVITNGVDVERLQPPADRSALRVALGLPRDTPIIGSIGRLEPVKNYELALRAFARLQPQSGGSAPLLVIVGDGSEATRLKGLAHELGLGPRVRFLGWRDDAERLYGAFDLFTLTSRSEGTSVSLLEAMSTGVCPVVTDVGGNRAVVGPELERLLVPADDEVALAAAWQRCLTDAGFRAGMGARARLRVSDAFSLERMIDQHARLYRELLPGPRS